MSGTETQRKPEAAPDVGHELVSLRRHGGFQRNVEKTAHYHTARSKQLMDDHRFPARCSWSSMRTFTMYLGRNDLAAPWTSRFVVDKREAVP